MLICSVYECRESALRCIHCRYSWIMHLCGKRPTDEWCDFLLVWIQSVDIVHGGREWYSHEECSSLGKDLHRWICVSYMRVWVSSLLHTLLMEIEYDTYREGGVGGGGEHSWWSRTESAQSSWAGIVHLNKPNSHVTFRLHSIPLINLHTESAFYCIHGDICLVCESSLKCRLGMISQLSRIMHFSGKRLTDEVLFRVSKLFLADIVHGDDKCRVLTEVVESAVVLRGVPEGVESAVVVVGGGFSNDSASMAV